MARRGVGGRSRRERGNVASAGLLVTLTGILLAAAIHADGYVTPEHELHDGGIWVTRGAVYGRANTQIAEIEMARQLDPVPADWELHQAGGTVLVHRQSDGTSGSIVPIDGAYAREVAEQQLVVAPDAVVGLGGPEEGVPTVAVLHPSDGSVWVGAWHDLLGQALFHPEAGEDVELS